MTLYVREAADYRPATIAEIAQALRNEGATTPVYVTSRLSGEMAYCDEADADGYVFDVRLLTEGAGR